jgi:hypothetical protein
MAQPVNYDVQVDENSVCSRAELFKACVLANI